MKLKNNQNQASSQLFLKYYVFYRQYKRKTYDTIPYFTVWKAIPLVAAGFVGGIFTAIAGSGTDICSFSVLCLLFRSFHKYFSLIQGNVDKCSFLLHFTQRTSLCHFALATKGPFINDVTLVLTFSDPPSPSVTFHHKNFNPPNKICHKLPYPPAPLNKWSHMQS